MKGSNYSSDTSECLGWQHPVLSCCFFSSPSIHTDDFIVFLSQLLKSQHELVFGLYAIPTSILYSNLCSNPVLSLVSVYTYMHGCSINTISVSRSHTPHKCALCLQGAPLKCSTTLHCENSCKMCVVKVKVLNSCSHWSSMIKHTA